MVVLPRLIEFFVLRPIPYYRATLPSPQRRLVSIWFNVFRGSERWTESRFWTLQLSFLAAGFSAHPLFHYEGGLGRPDIYFVVFSLLGKICEIVQCRRCGDAALSGRLNRELLHQSLLSALFVGSIELALLVFRVSGLDQLARKGSVFAHEPLYAVVFLVLIALVFVAHRKESNSEIVEPSGVLRDVSRAAWVYFIFASFLGEEFGSKGLTQIYVLLWSLVLLGALRLASDFVVRATFQWLDRLALRILLPVWAILCFVIWIRGAT